MASEKYYSDKDYEFFKSEAFKSKEEVKKLEEEKLMLLDMLGNRFASVPCVPEMEYQRVCEENEELKEENKEIRQIEKRCDRFVKKTLEECMKLKEKNEELQEEFDGWKASYDDDIRELEGNLSDATKQMEDAIFSAALMLGKIKKLKKVVKKLETTSD